MAVQLAHAHSKLGADSLYWVVSCVQYIDRENGKKNSLLFIIPYAYNKCSMVRVRVIYFLFQMHPSYNLKKRWAELHNPCSQLVGWLLSPKFTTESKVVIQRQLPNHEANVVHFMGMFMKSMFWDHLPLHVILNDIFFRVCKVIILTSVLLGCTLSRSVEFSTESKFPSRDSSCFTFWSRCNFKVRKKIDLYVLYRIFFFS